MSNKYILVSNYVLGEYVLTRDLQLCWVVMRLVSSSESKGISQVIYQASPLFSICKKIVKKENLIWDIGFLHVKEGLIIFSLILR